MTPRVCDSEGTPILVSWERQRELTPAESHAAAREWRERWARQKSAFDAHLKSPPEPWMLKLLGAKGPLA